MAYDPARHRLVFVGGLHRSGTTLLADLLAEHDEVSGFADTGVPADEGQHLQTVYPTARAIGGPGRFGFAKGARLTENSPLATAASAERLLSEWGPHWDRTRAVLVEKSPPNLLRTRFLQALFPDARFLLIVRHPVAVSLATRKWSQTSVPSLLRHWLVCHRAFAADRERLGRVHVVSYEHLAAEPEACLAGVFAFLDLAPPPRSLEVRAGSNEEYFARFRSHPVAAAALALRYEHAVARFGYSLRELSRRPEAPSSSRS